MKKGITVLEVVIVILMAIFASIIITKKMTSMVYYKKAANVRRNLSELRAGLESYYVDTGEYPKLVGKLGLNRVYTIVDGRNIYFQSYYNMEDMPYTSKGYKRKDTYSNKVYSVTDFKNGSNTGGWNYNEDGNTGEIHANIPDNNYNQNIDWSVE